MSATLTDLVNEVQSTLRSFGALAEPSTHLTGDISDSATSLAVANGDAVGMGVIEIDDELMYVESSSGGLLAVPPYGRGYNGTTAVSHTTGTRVVVGPVFPRKNVVDTLAEVSRAVFPQLFAVETLDFTASSSVAAYDLASDAERVLRVTVSSPGASQVWQELRTYRLDLNADTSVFPSGRAIVFDWPPTSGQTVRVVYAAPFTEMQDPGDTLTGSGFQESHRDVLVLGTVARLVQFLDAGRLNYSAVENEARAQYTQAGLASQVAGRIEARFQDRLLQERKRLLNLYQTNPRWSRP